GHRPGAGLGLDAADVAEIFDGNRHAVQRTVPAAGGQLPVRDASLLPSRVGQHSRVGVEHWLGLLDARQARLDQLLRADRALLQAAAGLRDGEIGALAHSQSALKVSEGAVSISSTALNASM